MKLNGLSVGPMIVLILVAFFVLGPALIYGIVDVAAIQWLKTGWSPLGYWHCFELWLMIALLLHSKSSSTD